VAPCPNDAGNGINGGLGVTGSMHQYFRTESLLQVGFFGNRNETDFDIQCIYWGSTHTKKKRKEEAGLGTESSLTTVQARQDCGQSNTGLWDENCLSM
jgi:hypothetical protein